jgi:hypothetical protein
MRLIRNAVRSPMTKAGVEGLVRRFQPTGFSKRFRERARLEFAVPAINSLRG